jgi:hypothetical protein
MDYDHLLALLTKARAVLDHHLFEDGGDIRDDVAEICMQIDEAMPAPERLNVRASEEPALEHSAAA